MSLPKKITVRQVPEVLRIFLTTLKDPRICDIYECKNRQELMDISEHFPLEIASVPKRLLGPNTKKGPILGYFIVGVATPVSKQFKVDNFDKPVFVFYYLNDHDWREWKDGIKKEVAIRNARYKKERAAWKDLGQQSANKW